MMFFLYFIANIDEDTGCPTNIEHVCEICAEDRNRLGCYCELDDGTEIITASIFTRCPITGKKITVTKTR